MTKVFFDLDGTITAYPVACEAMARAFRLSGYKVYVLTGHATNGDLSNIDRKIVEQQKREAMIHRGFASFDELIVVYGRNSSDVARSKAGHCKDHAATILIDDALDYCQAVKQANPNMLVLHVHER